MKTLPQKIDIFLKNATVLTEDFTIEYDKNIAIHNGKILEITNNDNYQVEQVIDCTDLLLMPGLVDGHLHTSQQLLRGRLLDEKPVIWKRINVPFESQLNKDLSELSAEVAALEMIRSGTTGFVDVGNKFPMSFASIYEQSGLRGRLTYMTNDSKFAPDALRTTSLESMERLVELNKSLDGILRGYFSLVSLTVVSEEMIHAVCSKAKEKNIPITVHMNEYSSEIFEFIEKYGMRPFEYLEKNNLISEKFIASHCIFLSETEKVIIKDHGIKVIHCPFSNSGKGIPATPTLLAMGIDAGMGTDGSAHGGLDLFKEMRLFRGIMNVSHGVNSADPQIMPAETLLRMATKNSANALFEDNLGILKEGNLADIIAIDIMQPHLFPTHNLAHSLVESSCGSDVVHMIVNGRLIMKDREVLNLDEEKIKYHVKDYMKKYPHLANWT